MIHICYLSNEYPEKGKSQGGIGSFISTIGPALASLGCRITVIGFTALTKDQYEIDRGVQIIRLRKSGWKRASFLDNSKRLNKGIRDLHAKNPIDILETSELGLGFIKKFPGPKFIIRLHGGHHFFSEAENRKINKWKAFQENRSIAKADNIIGVSKYVLNRTVKHLKIDNKKCKVIYNPVDTARFYKSNPEKKVPGRILFTGTVCEKKGIRQLIMAMPMIISEWPKAHLVVAGRDWKFKDGSSYTEYLKQFIDPKISNSISFLGAIANDKIPGLIEEAEVCVYPSHMEAMPIAWLEAMSMAKAFIGGNTGPAQELISDGVTGLLCDPHNPADIAIKVLTLLKDDKLGTIMGANARNEVLKKFSAEKIIRENLDFYLGLL